MGFMRQILAFAFIALFAAACAETPAPAPVAAVAALPPPPPIEQQVAALKSRLFDLVSEQRRALDATAHPLKADPELEMAAQAHADAMAKQKTFGADSTDNLAIGKLLDDPDFSGYVGENIAAQFYTASVGMDPNSFAHGFIDIWLKSDQHKSNLVFPAFEKTGIGIAVTGDEVFVAQLFATKLLGAPTPAPKPAK